MVEDIITTLSHVSSLFVVARNSSFAFKDQNLDIREVGRQLGVRYVLEGSIRRSGDRLRITAQLIDAADGTHVWAERYDRRVHDIFDIQDELTKEIVTALRIKLTDGEQAGVWLRSTNNVEAWGCAMRGADHLWRGTAANIAEARSLLERAVAIDHGYAKATALIALTHYFDARFNYASSQDESKRKHAEFAAKALELDPNEPYSLLMRSGVRSFEGRFAEAFEDVKLALEKSPNDAYCWVRSARILIHLDRADEAEAAIRQAMRLNPFYPIQYLSILGDVLAHQDRNEEAVAIFQDVVRREPRYLSGYVHLARAYSALGNAEAARGAATEALRIDPKYSIAAARSLYMSVNAGRRQAFLQDLQAAGIPA
jgi:adenylate cyclase